MLVVVVVAGSATQVWAVANVLYIFLRHVRRVLETLELFVAAAASPDLQLPRGAVFVVLFDGQAINIAGAAPEARGVIGRLGVP